jgi:hypothetical protein
MAYKSRSITSKASSAVKINIGLTEGARDLGNSKKFVDYSSSMKEGFDKKDATKEEVVFKKDEKDEKDEKEKKPKVDVIEPKNQV